MKEGFRLPIERQEVTLGKNVQIHLFAMRHGDRSPEGALSDEGREQARLRGEAFRARLAETGGVDAVKVYGSTDGPQIPIETPNGEMEMGRAGETGFIAGSQIDPEYQHEVDLVEALGHEKILTPAPYEGSYPDFYKSFLPDNYAELEGDVKIAAGNEAQKKIVEYYFEKAETTENGATYFKEIAGAVAFRILEYQRMAHKLYSDSSLAIVQGGHGPSFDFLFKSALIRESPDGGEPIRGFETLDEIGGQQQTAEGFDIKIGTTTEGQDAEITLEFVESHRPAGVMKLDREVLRELAAFYADLHQIKSRLASPVQAQ